MRGIESAPQGEIRRIGVGKGGERERREKYGPVLKHMPPILPFSPKSRHHPEG